MDYFEYTDPENWTAGFYELSIEYHPVGINNKINDALIALQNCPFFDGLWKERENFNKDILTLPLEIEDDSATSYYVMEHYLFLIKLLYLALLQLSG